MWSRCVVCFLFFINVYQSISFHASNEGLEKLKGRNNNVSKHNDIYITTGDPLLSTFGNLSYNMKERTSIRVKRQSGGAGKFTEAAKMTEIKILRMYLTLFKNMWSKTYVGGPHPMHPEVPKTIVMLFKQKIMGFFFPPVGEDAIKDR